MLKKIFGLLFLILFILSGCVPNDNEPNLYELIKKRDKLIVGISFDAKPFSFKDSDGKLKGIEVDLSKEIAKRMLGSKEKILFKNTSPQDRIKAVTSGDVDIVISTMTITPKRKKLVNFSEPYFIAGQAVCAKKNRKIQTIDDLINKKIIVILGTTGEENIKSFVPTAFIWGFLENSDAIEAFKTSSADAITTDDSLLQGLIMDNNNYIILPTRLTQEPYGIAFKKSVNTTDFKNALNKIINDIKNDGTLDMIKEKWGIS